MTNKNDCTPPIHSAEHIGYDRKERYDEFKKDRIREQEVLKEASIHSDSAAEIKATAKRLFGPQTGRTYTEGERDAFAKSFAKYYLRIVHEPLMDKSYEVDDILKDFLKPKP